MNDKNLTLINEYIKNLSKISKRMLSESGSITEEERDMIIDGYEQIARPIIDILGMHDPQTVILEGSTIKFNNPAELIIKTSRQDIINDGIIYLKQVKARFNSFLQFPDQFNKQSEIELQESEINKIINLLERFHSLTKILSSRRRNKQPLEFEDEYDVQDAVFLILKSYYSSANREDPVIAVGKGTSRIDIVIYELEIIIEIKFVYDTSDEKSIVEALKTDFESYHEHKSCKTLIAFIYDPKTSLKDPMKIIKDLNGSRTKNSKNFNVIVVISPK